MHEEYVGDTIYLDGHLVEEWNVDWLIAEKEMYNGNT